MIISGSLHLPFNPRLSSQGARRKDLVDFYGKNSPLGVKYVHDCSGLNFGKAHESSYRLEALIVK
jgi:hypothetical protein